MKFHDLYCQLCRQSYTALEAAPHASEKTMADCISGKRHYFTEQIPAEELLKTHLVPATVH
jgi:hypothetical protein